MVKTILNTPIAKPISSLFFGFNLKIILEKATEDLKSLCFKLTVVGINSEGKKWFS